MDGGSRTPTQGSPKGSAKEQCSRTPHRCPLTVHSATHDTGRITPGGRSVKPTPRRAALPRRTGDPGRTPADGGTASADIPGARPWTIRVKQRACPGPTGDVSQRTPRRIPPPKAGKHSPRSPSRFPGRDIIASHGQFAHADTGPTARNHLSFAHRPAQEGSDTAPSTTYGTSDHDPGDLRTQNPVRNGGVPDRPDPEALSALQPHQDTGKRPRLPWGGTAASRRPAGDWGPRRTT
jgi:hypothetical protein